MTCNERGITVFELFGEKYLAAMDKYIRICNTRNEKQKKKIGAYFFVPLLKEVVSYISHMWQKIYLI